MPVDYILDSVMKNKNNSAVINLKPKRNLPFPISYDELIDENGISRLNLTIDVNETYFRLTNTLVSVQNNEIALLIEYNFTIECSATTIDIDLTETMYTPLTNQANFNACGTMYL